MITDSGWSAIATMVLAFITALLALATFWMARKTSALVDETKRARVEAANEYRRALFRRALVEQLENCRCWMVNDPARRSQATQNLKQQPEFDGIGELLAGVDLPPLLMGHLLSRIARILELHSRVQALLTAGDEPEPARERQRELGDLRGVILDDIQSVTCLLMAEARRRPDVSEVAAGFEGSRWLIVLPGPDHQRALEMANAVATGGMAPFPSDVAYEACSPEARDLAGAATADRTAAAALRLPVEVARVVRRKDQQGR